MANVPAAPVEKKKGLSPLAWVGIGCLGILVLGGIVATIVTVFVVKKAKDLAQEIQDDPVAVTAKALAAADTDVEFVKADKAKRTVTFRDVKTGKEMTFGYDDIEKGRVTFTSEGKTATVEVNPNKEGDGGQLTVRTDEGAATFRAGGDAKNLPDWIPVFPGVVPKGVVDSETPEGRTGTFGFETDRGSDEILNFYEKELKAKGFEIHNRMAMGEGSMLMASKEDDNRTLTVMISKKGARVEAVLQFLEQHKK